MKKSNCKAWCTSCDTNNIHYTIEKGSYKYECLNCGKIMTGREVMPTGPNKKFEISQKEADIIVDAIDFHIEGCMLDPEGNRQYIDEASAIRNKLARKQLKSVIVNVKLKIDTPYFSEFEAEEYAENYELPSNYVEDSFDLVEIINTNEE